MIELSTVRSNVFVREYSVSNKVSIDELLVSLRARRVSGEIRIVISQGGTRQVLFIERTEMIGEIPETLEKV